MLKRVIKKAVIICMVLAVPYAAIAFKSILFRGYVLDVRGQAVKGAEIFVYNSPDTRRPADFISGRTDDEGGFTISLPAGKYWVVARVRSGEKYGPLMSGDKHSGSPMEIDIDQAGTVEQNFTVMDIKEAARLMKKTGEDYFRVQGKILDKNGAPLAHMYMFANNDMKMKEIPDYLSAWTNKTGEYTIYLPAGRYYVGHASEFPPVMQNNVLIELEVELNLAGFDIMTDYVTQIDSEAVEGQ